MRVLLAAQVALDAGRAAPRGRPGRQHGTGLGREGRAGPLRVALAGRAGQPPEVAVLGGLQVALEDRLGHEHLGAVGALEGAVVVRRLGHLGGLGGPG